MSDTLNKLARLNQKIMKNNRVNCWWIDFYTIFWYHYLEMIKYSAPPLEPHINCKLLFLFITVDCFLWGTRWRAAAVCICIYKSVKTNGQVEKNLGKNVVTFSVLHVVLKNYVQTFRQWRFCSRPARLSRAKQFDTTQISNLKTQKLESFEGNIYIELWGKLLCSFLFFQSFCCPLKFYILLFLISIAYLRGVANETENDFRFSYSSWCQLLFPPLRYAHALSWVFFFFLSTLIRKLLFIGHMHF